MTNSIHLGLWQSGGTNGDIAANGAEIARAAQEAAAKGVAVLVFPECFLTGYFASSSVSQRAGQVIGAVKAHLAEISARTGVCLVIGSYEVQDAAVTNSALVITPEGGHIASYAKRALFGDWEREVFVPAKCALVFDWQGVRFGVLICYDIEFPERVRELAQLAVDVVLCPTALMAPFDTVPRHIVAARAFENHLFVAYANRIGQEGAWDFIGQSLIAGPLGDKIAQADQQEGLIHAHLDLGARDASRQHYDYLKDLKRFD